MRRRRRRHNPFRLGKKRMSPLVKIILAIVAGVAVFLIVKKVRAAQGASQLGPVGPSPSPLPSGGGSAAPSLPAASGGGMSEVFPGSESPGGSVGPMVLGEDFTNG